ncbi:MAG: hypothetical protein AAGG79_00325 [Pseudomonadota bacterium]
MTVTPTTIDAILAGVGAEAIVLVLLLRRFALQRWTAPLLAFLASGAAMMLCVRLALQGEGLWALAPLLLAAGVLHAACLLLAARVSAAKDA